MPRLRDRRNIIVIADEADRSQYDLIDGLARHMRDALAEASFIGFTARPSRRPTPKRGGRSATTSSIYDIQRAVEDKATVSIYRESRIAKLVLNPPSCRKLDEEFEEITRARKSADEKLKTKWAALEALVGDEKRLEADCRRPGDHFERRLEAMTARR